MMMTMLATLLIVLAAPVEVSVNPLPGECYSTYCIGTGEWITGPGTCQGLPSLTTRHSWGTITSCHVAVPVDDNPELLGNYLIRVEVCALAPSIFNDGFESGNLAAWK